MASDAPSPVPHIQLLCMEEHFGEAFLEACKERRLPGSISYQIHNSSLNGHPASAGFDTIVSPANSYGRLDGSFDDAISRALAPSDDYHAITRVAQRRLYEQWRGFAPPGTCTLVRFPDEFASRSRNIWGCRRVALCPTMRQPADVRWDREVVYECVWSLLCAIDNHNRDVRAGRAPAGDDEEIRCILMTPLATGCGLVTAQRWASQAVLALKHFVEASQNPDKWSKLGWGDLAKSCAEVQTTWSPNFSRNR